MEAPTYIVVDLETTGSSLSKGGRIIQIGMVTVSDGKIIQTFSTFINPEQKIPAFIQELTGIRNEDVESAPLFEEVAPEIRETLEDAIFVAHNADFDLTFLNAEFQRAGIARWRGLVVDTVELSRLAFPTAFSYKLQDIASELGIPLSSAHRADEDAVATAKLFMETEKKLSSLPFRTLELLHKRSFGLRSDISSLLFRILSMKDRSAVGSAHTSFKGIPLKLPEQEESVRPLRYERQSDPVRLLSKTMPYFEYRESQEKLIGTVSRALAQKEEVVMEAATGMGKTIGYLLPAAEYALSSGEQVIISTYTTHLQEQLLRNEGRIVKECVGHPLSIALVKGMSHYLDLQRLSEQLASDDESYDETFTLMQVLVWLVSTSVGDLTELNVSGGGQLVLDKMRRSHMRTPVKEERELDFYDRARKKAATAHIVVTNHAFLLGGGLGEKPASLIVDEAHQLIQAALSKKKRTFVYTNWKYIFGQIGNSEDEQLFTRFLAVSQQTGIAAEHELLRLEYLFNRISEKFDQISGTLSARFIQSAGNSRQKKWSFPLSSIGRQETEMMVMFKLLNSWIDLSRTLLSRADSLTELEISQHVILNDWRYWTEEIAENTIALADIFVFPAAEDISWAEGDLRSLPNSLAVYNRPFEVTDPVNNVLGPLRNKYGIVLLSGTMTVPADERFILRQLGIADSVPLIRFEPEPEFYEGARVYVVEDMPDIRQVPQSDYIEAVADAVTQTVLVTEGRCFVLFTSQDMLRRTVELIQDSGLLDEYMLFAQGLSSGSRMRLLKSFQRFSKSVLFGTNSFWEGVDVPGDALRAVVVVRLPFTSPDDPVYTARSERLMAQGKNPFLAHALPEAVIRLRQGFGRLIRSKGDRGLFIVLDRRIHTKSYGPEFLRALPPVPTANVTLEKMVSSIEDWYNEGG
ncbi:ATP-dependent DNA helicase DinG [Indiicoccus explosivorum]|uniref:ATP-dependent DNA helicase DinG n=1 Tax=Indiicoccus explosivorum TaxID=1917864 RepID=UPI000B42CF72|nr:ATP-dependent DNA helicase DinG [Indiicoccus explosivorum]